MGIADTEKLAEEGNIEAQCSMALFYELGLEGELDFEKAANWWRKAAQQGSGWAMEKLGILADKGLIQDDAKKWHKKAKINGFRLPGELCELAVADKEKPSSKSDQSKKVLVIDDERDVRIILHNILEGVGYMILEAANANEAFDIIANNPDISLIMIDLKMPGMNGLQFIKTLRRLGAATGVPMLIITAYSKPEYIMAAKKLGVEAWINKPFNSSSIVETVNKLVG